MQLETSRFGTIEYDPNDVITFTQPILGFQEFRRFVLLPGPQGNAVRWLQSTDKGDLAFIIMNPRQVLPDYTLQLGAHELAELAVTKAEELEVYTLVVVPHDNTQVRTNLRAPILISLKHRLAKQTILERSDYPIQFYLARTQQGDKSPEEASHARSDA
jgi:flagellar assembly factor FliW